MEIQLEYWHWFILGVILAVTEIFAASFTVLWFGLGALIVSVTLFLFPALSLQWQILIWILSSIIFILIWFKYLKELIPNRSTSGMSKEAIMGEAGQVIIAPFENKKGTVRFIMPILGSDEWPFICKEEVKVGDKVVIIDVSGNTLVVSKSNQG